MGISKKAIRQLEKYRRLEDNLTEEKILKTRPQLAFDYIQGVPDDGKPYLLAYGDDHVLVKINPFSQRKDVWYMDGSGQNWKREEDVVMLGRRKVHQGVLFDGEEHEDEVKEQSIKDRTSFFTEQSKPQEEPKSFRQWADDKLKEMGIE